MSLELCLVTLMPSKYRSLKYFSCVGFIILMRQGTCRSLKYVSCVERIILINFRQYVQDRIVTLKLTQIHRELFSCIATKNLFP